MALHPAASHLSGAMNRHPGDTHNDLLTAQDVAGMTGLSVHTLSWWPSPGTSQRDSAPPQPPRPTLIAVRQILLRAVVLLGSWAIGLLVAAWVVPGVSLSVSGFIVGVVVFSVAQVILSLLILKLPHGYASLLLGGAGLALTIVALSLASVATHGLTIHGIASWVATTIVVWLVTTVGAISLPELFARDDVGST